MTTTDANRTEFKMKIMMTFNAPLHTHEGNRPGKVHLGRLFHGYIDNHPQPEIYDSYCGRMKNVRTEECTKNGHDTMAQCKDCLKNRLMIQSKNHQALTF